MSVPQIRWDEFQRRQREGLISPEQAEQIGSIIGKLEQVAERNKLAMFWPHSDPQREFLEAKTDVVAAFAGNQFGKSTVLAVRALVELIDRAAVPKHLAHIKRFDPPVYGWIMCPTNDKIYDSLVPALLDWMPWDQLLTGKWEGSWSKERKQLHFKNGSHLTFKTYEQHHSTLGGARLHFVGYDEPPPKLHRDEGMTRLLRYGGYEMFAMTPLKTNTGWIRREIYRKREHPDITVIRGSMHDNPTLDAVKREKVLGSYGNDLWRRAREFGDFIDIGGAIYPEFDRCVVKEPWDRKFIQGLDVVVGIDPGIRNCGICWVGFDSELVAYVFDEGLLQDKVPADYARFIRHVNARWGLGRVRYVVDPAAKQRAQSNGMTVLSLLNKERIYPNLGQNDYELGFGQIRQRMAHDRFWVSPECRRLRDQADDYAAVEPDEGKDDSHLEPVKGNDHLLDAMRYAVLERFWDPMRERHAPDRQLGWVPGTAPTQEWWDQNAPVEGSPLGFMS